MLYFFVIMSLNSFAHFDQPPINSEHKAETFEEARERTKILGAKAAEEAMKERERIVRGKIERGEETSVIERAQHHMIGGREFVFLPMPPAPKQ